MPTYNALINHNDAAALIPEQQVREIFENVAAESQVFKLCRRLPNMSSNRTRIKVLDSLPVVYWQSSNTAKKQTSNAALSLAGRPLMGCRGRQPLQNLLLRN